MELKFDKENGFISYEKFKDIDVTNWYEFSGIIISYWNISHFIIMFWSKLYIDYNF